jgi:hypothetical protein
LCLAFFHNHVHIELNKMNKIEVFGHITYGLRARMDIMCKVASGKTY